MIDSLTSGAASTDAAAKTANPAVIPYFMWTGDEPQAAAATAVYNLLFGSGNFMTLDSPGMHNFTFGDGVAMRLSSDSAEEVESACQALGLAGAEITEGTEAVVKPDRFGVYWTL